MWIVIGFLLLLPDSEAVQVSPGESGQPVQAAQAEPQENGGAPVVAQDVAIPDTGGVLPLMIRWSNWQSEFGPAIVYAREADLNGMLRMDGPVTKMVMVA